MAKKQGGEIAVVTVQEQALLKVNVTETVLAQLEKEYTGLTIAGIDDKDGFLKVKAARKKCKDWRILADKICKEGRENAVKEQKLWLKEAARVIGRIEAVEKPLKAEEDRITAELEAIKTAKKEAESRMIADRILSFSEVGAVLDYDMARDMSTSEYKDTLEGITAEYNAKKEAERIEAERVEAIAKAERERIEVDRLAEIKKAQAPDKEKLLVIAREIQSIFFPEMVTSEGRRIAGDAAEMLIKAADHIKEKCAEL